MRDQSSDAIADIRAKHKAADQTLNPPCRMDVSGGIGVRCRGLPIKATNKELSDGLKELHKLVR